MGYIGEGNEDFKDGLDVVGDTYDDSQDIHILPSLQRP